MSTPPEYCWEEPWSDWGWWMGVISTALATWMCLFFCWHERHRLCGRRQPDPSIPLMILLVFLVLIVVGDKEGAAPGEHRQMGTRLLNKTSRGENYHKMWKDNIYIKDMFKFTTMLNLSNCWLCMHIPPYAKRPGLMLHGIPIGNIFNIERSLCASSFSLLYVYPR